jgi:hypothetical protein
MAASAQFAKREDNSLPILRRTPKFDGFARQYLTFYGTEDAKRPRTMETERGHLNQWIERLGETRPTLSPRPWSIDFPFHGEQSLFHAIARLLTPACIIGWQAKTPFWLFAANQRRVGKDTLDMVPFFVRWRPSPRIQRDTLGIYCRVSNIQMTKT